MSTALAMAAVTAVIKDLLDNGLIVHEAASTVGDVVVTALPPDRIAQTSTDEKAQLNLFMYHVTPNAGWRNRDYPSRNANGDLIANPPLAVDLHYMVSAYGSQDFHTEVLLGYAMQILHESPVLTRAAINLALQPSFDIDPTGIPPILQDLATSGLADQVEQIKIWPETIDTEELSRLWTAMQTHYRPTAFYQVSVVLIQNTLATRVAPPVKSYNIYAQPFRQPTINQVLSQSPTQTAPIAAQQILAGYQLALQGTQLKGAITQVLLDGQAVPAAGLSITDTLAQFPIPTGTAAGVHGAQVAQLMEMGTAPNTAPHLAVESNAVAFVLCPQVTGVTSTVTETGTNPGSGTVSVTANPSINPGQRVVLLMNEAIIPVGRAPYMFSFTAPAVPQGSAIATIVIPVTGVPSGTYLIRIQVDGAESPLQSSATGTYNGPELTI